MTTILGIIAILATYWLVSSIQDRSLAIKRAQQLSEIQKEKNRIMLLIAARRGYIDSEHEIQNLIVMMRRLNVKDSQILDTIGQIRAKQSVINCKKTLSWV